jgi:multidrug efflux system membrane fusion protein
MMTTNRISLILSAAVLAVAACQKEAPRAEPPPPKVTVAHPEVREFVESDTYNGWMDASAVVELRARVRGHIQKVAFTDGELVKKDQLLFQLDPRPFEANVERAKDQANIYQAQLVAAQKEDARLKELLSKGGSSQSQVDKAEADAKSLEAQLEAAKQEIKRVSLDLEYARITSPVDGRIGKANLSEGNLVNAGGSDPLLTTIVAIDPVYVYFSVDERAALRYQKNRAEQEPGDAPRTGALKGTQMPFQFGLENDQGYPHEGMLDFVNNQVDRTTGTVMVRGVVPNPRGLFIAGSRVKVRIPVSKAKSTLLVPDTALLSDQDKRYLLVVDEKNIVLRCDITPGRLLDDGSRIVTSSTGKPVLVPESWIVVLGLQSARINYPVVPVKAEASTQPAATMASR